MGAFSAEIAIILLGCLVGNVVVETSFFPDSNDRHSNGTFPCWDEKTNHKITQATLKTENPFTSSLFML